MQLSVASTIPGEPEFGHRLDDTARIAVAPRTHDRNVQVGDGVGTIPSRISLNRTNTMSSQRHTGVMACDTARKTAKHADIGS